jgi:hypothetical protein
MPDLDIDAFVRGFVGVGSEIIPIPANGRRTVAVYRQVSEDACDKIIKVSRFDQSIFSVNKFFADHPDLCDSLFYSQPRILSLHRQQDLLVVVYSSVEYRPISWSDLRSYSTVFDLVRAIADLNSTASSSFANLSFVSGIRPKEFRLSLTLDKLSSIFPSWSASKCEHYFDLAWNSYHDLLGFASSLGAISDCSSVLSHNDLVPKNILAMSACQSKYTFIDFDDACIAPVGIDLRFIVAANYLQPDLLDRMYRISSFYADCCLTFWGSRHVSASLVSRNAFIGYIDAWLNIHLRARTRFDERRFIGCLSVCQRLRSHWTAGL